LSSKACVNSAWMNNRASVCCRVPPHPSASKQTAVLLYCRWDGFIEPLKTGNCYPNLKCTWDLYPPSSRAEVQASTSASGYVLAREQELLFILSIMLVNVTSWRVRSIENALKAPGECPHQMIERYCIVYEGQITAARSSGGIK
jgi:hypothetical protein